MKTKAELLRMFYEDPQDTLPMPLGADNAAGCWEAAAQENYQRHLADLKTLMQDMDKHNWALVEEFIPKDQLRFIANRWWMPREK